MSFKVIIFSKDRPMQVEACIRSLNKHFNMTNMYVHVLFKATTKEFIKGYNQAAKLQPAAYWAPEKHNFKEQLVHLMKGCALTQYTVFLVDDIIFTDTVSIEDKQFSLLQNNNLMTAISLRLHDGITECYATSKQTEVPKFSKKCVWSWENKQGDWGYPMSVDGNIYNSNFIDPCIERLNFINPNTLEESLSQIRPLPKYVCCYPERPKLINIPANRVQNLFKNKHAEGLTVEELNTLFLEDNIIDIEHYAQLKEKTVHCPLDLKIKKI